MGSGLGCPITDMSMFFAFLQLVIEPIVGGVSVARDSPFHVTSLNIWATLVVAQHQPYNCKYCDICMLYTVAFVN